MRLDVQYALSTLGKTVPFAAADAFSLYFYTDVVGIAPAMAGAMVLITLSWSAICDPLAGWIYQARFVQRIGKRRYFTLGCIAATAFYILAFAKLWSGPGLWPLLLLAAMLFRFSYALIDVPHNALLSLLAHKGQSPVTLGAVRLGATIVGSLAAIIAARFALAAPPIAASDKFLVFAIITGTIGALFFIGAFPFSVADPSVSARIAPHNIPHTRYKMAYAAATALFLSAVAATIINGMFSKDIVYIAKYVLQNPGWTTTGLAIFTIGKIIGIPFWVIFFRKAGAVWAIMASFALIAATGVAVAIAPPHFSYLGTGLLFFGIGIAGTNIGGWTLVPSCAEFFRPDSEPFFFGLFTAVNKVASGLSGAIIGYTLTVLGIDNHSISSEFQIKSLYWLIYVYPIIGATIGIAAILLYNFSNRSNDKSSSLPLALENESEILI